jgi:hypothetical protein
MVLSAQPELASSATPKTTLTALLDTAVTISMEALLNNVSSTGAQKIPIATMLPSIVTLPNSAPRLLVPELTVTLAVPQIYAYLESVLLAPLMESLKLLAPKALLATLQDQLEMFASSTAVLVMALNPVIPQTINVKPLPALLLENFALQSLVVTLTSASPTLVENALLLKARQTHAQQDISALLVLPAKQLHLECATLSNATTLTSLAWKTKHATVDCAKQLPALELTVTLANLPTFASVAHALSAPLMESPKLLAPKALLVTHPDQLEMFACSIAVLVMAMNPVIPQTTNVKPLPALLLENFALLILVVTLTSASPTLVENAQLELFQLTHVQQDISARLVPLDKLLHQECAMLRNAMTPTTCAHSTMNV